MIFKRIKSLRWLLTMVFLIGCSKAKGPEMQRSPGTHPNFRNPLIQTPELQREAEQAQIPAVCTHTNVPGSQYPRRASQVAFLKPGKELFQARLDLIQRARQSIWIQVYETENDATARRLADELFAARRRGVDVRMIVDAFANYNAQQQSFLAHLYSNGVQPLGFEPMYRRLFDGLSKKESFAEYFAVNNFRHHEKMFIKDARTAEAEAIVGGANLSNVYFGFEAEHSKEVAVRPWIDNDVWLRGEVVGDMACAFEQNYAYHSNEQNSKNNDNIISMIQSWLTDSLFPKSSERNLDLPNGFVIRPENAVVRFVQSRPLLDERGIEDLYVQMMQEARQEILIVSPYFIPPENIQTAFVEAAQRGVKVKILTVAKEVNDFSFVTEAGRLLYTRLLQFPNIEIYEWGGGGAAEEAPMYHSKFAVFDRQKAIIGSYNLDPRSLGLNSESVVALEGGQTVQALYQQFASSITSHLAHPISMEEARSFRDTNGMMDYLQKNMILGLSPLL